MDECVSGKGSPELNKDRVICLVLVEGMISIASDN